jgi:hypothetical protein
MLQRFILSGTPTEAAVRGTVMKNYIINDGQEILTAELMPADTEYYLFTATNPNLPVDTRLSEQDNPDAPSFRIAGAATQANNGPWFMPIEPLMQEYSVSYSFLTFTHSTIAGCMIQSAATREEAASQIRTLLTKIYRPVEIDHVTAVKI